MIGRGFALPGALFDACATMYDYPVTGRTVPATPPGMNLKSRPGLCGLRRLQCKEEQMKRTVTYPLTMFFLSFALAVSFNVSAAGKDVLRCSSSDNINEYNDLQDLIQNSPKLFLMNNLSIVSLCIGKEREGMGYLQQAADAGFIGTVYLLGLYFKLNQTFDTSEKHETHSLQDLNAALEYYNKAADLIDSIPDYPEGGTPQDLGMGEVEYYSYTSYYVFATLPDLYFRGYDTAMDNILESPEKLDYTDAFEVLSKMQHSAERCLQRPSLSVWYDKQDAVYGAQQFRCQVYLDYAKAVLPLEEERAEAARACETRLSECEAHQEVLNEINRRRDVMTQEINSLPLEFREE